MHLLELLLLGVDPRAWTLKPATGNNFSDRLSWYYEVQTQQTYTFRPSVVIAPNSEAYERTFRADLSGVF